MSVRRSFVLGVLALFALSLATSCARTEDPGSDGQSHWLVACTNDDACGSELSCHCGRCTMTCQRFDQCGEVNTCYEATQFCGEAVGSFGLCTRACDEDEDCPTGLTCSEQRCVVNLGEMSAETPEAPDASTMSDSGTSPGPVASPGASTSSDAGFSPPDPCRTGFVLQLPAAAIAERLSTALYSLPAEPAFLQRVSDAHLDTSGAVGCFVDELLLEPEARPMVEAFFRQWLELDLSTTPDPIAFPEFTADTLEALREETLRFTTSVTLDEAGSLSTLLTSEFGFANSESAPIYGVVVDGTELQRIDFAGTGRVGVFGQAFFLTTRSHPDTTSPARRGLALARDLLCLNVPPPPPSVDRSMLVPPEGTTLRDLYTQHTVNPACASCHQLFDPMGFAFENFDAIGRLRSEEQGVPIDTSGSMTFNGETLDFINLEELMGGLAASASAQSCYSHHWLSFLLGRELTAEEQSIADEISLAAQVGGELRLTRVISQSMASEPFLLQP